MTVQLCVVVTKACHLARDTRVSKHLLSVLRTLLLFMELHRLRLSDLGLLEILIGRKRPVADWSRVRSSGFRAHREDTHAVK